jgi:hypothetical protein
VTREVTFGLSAFPSLGVPFVSRPIVTAAPSLQLPTETSPLPSPVSHPDSTTVPPVSKGVGCDGVRVCGRDRVRRGSGVAEVALGEAERVAGGESVVGGGRALAEEIG